MGVRVELLLIVNEDLVLVNYEGKECNSLANYTLTLKVKCNKNIEKQNAVPILLNQTECAFSILLEVDKGCPIVSVSVILNFISIHTPLFSVGFMALGVALGIFGRSMWATVVFGLVMFTFIILSMVLFRLCIRYFFTSLYFLLMLLSGITGSLYLAVLS